MIPDGEYLPRISLLQHIKIEQFIYIISPCNSGKTVFAIEKLSDFINNYLNKKLIILEPYIANAKQKANKYGLHCIHEGIMPNDDPIQIGTYDSIIKLEKIETPLSDYVLVVDEAHNLVSESGYRTEAMNNIIGYQDAFHKVIYFTATPIEIMKDSIYKDFKVFRFHDILPDIKYKLVVNKDKMQ